MKAQKRARNGVFVEAAEEHAFGFSRYSCCSLSEVGATDTEKAAYVAMMGGRRLHHQTDPSLHLCYLLTYVNQDDCYHRRNHCIFALLFAEEFFRGVDLVDFIAEAETYPPTCTVPLERAGIILEGSEAVHAPLS